MESENEIHTASRMAMPVNIAFAGGKGCGITAPISNSVQRLMVLERTTRLIPSPRTVLIKGEHKMPA